MNQEYRDDAVSDVSAWKWAYHNKIRLQAGVYQVKGHAWQVELMDCQAMLRVCLKAAQLGMTEVEVLRTLHGMIKGRYPTGVLYLFPTSDDVSDFSKARFNPMIADNPELIGSYVKSTDSTNIKRIGTGMLYLRGAKLTQKVEGVKKDSSKLRSIPVDKVIFDERDLMEGGAIDMALERMSHSTVKEEVTFSTPTVPGYGVDAVHSESDQRSWFIQCGACNEWTCLELSFPDCIQNGKKCCMRCGEELDTDNGEWVAAYPGRERVGWHISQLNSPFIDPTKIVSLYHHPPNGNLQEVMNSKLGLPYIDAKDVLTKGDVYACCGLDPIRGGDSGPCAMGVDVGSLLHVVIGKKLSKKRKVILYIGKVAEFSDLHDLAKKFNVQTAIIDMYPETRKVREFRDDEDYDVFGCQYRDDLTKDELLDTEAKIITVSRTEICDRTHDAIKTLGYELPRRTPELEEYAASLASTFRMLEERSGGGYVYRYKKSDIDHFRHATNYFELASELVPDVEQLKAALLRGDSLAARAQNLKVDTHGNPEYDPLTDGMRN